MICREKCPLDPDVPPIIIKEKDNTLTYIPDKILYIYIYIYTFFFFFFKFLLDLGSFCVATHRPYVGFHVMVPMGFKARVVLQLACVQ